MTNIQGSELLNEASSLAALHSAVFLSDALPGGRKNLMDLHSTYYIGHFGLENSLLMTLFHVGTIRETQMQHERGPHTHLKHKLSSAWGKTYVMYSHCEFG